MEKNSKSKVGNNTEVKKDKVVKVGNAAEDKVVKVGNAAEDKVVKAEVKVEVVDMVKLVGSLEGGKNDISVIKELVFAGNVNPPSKVVVPFADKSELNVRFNVLDVKEVNFVNVIDFKGSNGKDYKYMFTAFYEEKDNKMVKVGKESCFIYSVTDNKFIGTWLSAGTCIGLLRLIMNETSKQGFSKMDTFYKSATMRSDKNSGKNSKNAKAEAVEFSI